MMDYKLYIKSLPFNQRLFHFVFYSLLGFLSFAYVFLFIFALYSYFNPTTSNLEWLSDFALRISDPLFQFLGWMSLVGMLFVLLWGLASIRFYQRLDYKKYRLAAFVFGMSLLAYSFAGLTANENFYTSRSLLASGLLGDRLYVLIHPYVALYFSDMAEWGLVVLTVLTALFFLMFASGVAYERWHHMVIWMLSVIKDFAMDLWRGLMRLNLIPIFSSPFKKADNLEEEIDVKAPAKTKGVGSGKKEKRTMPLSNVFMLPSVDLLAKTKSMGTHLKLSAAALKENAAVLETVLADFGVRGEIKRVHPGPVVTLYELLPAPGIKASRIVGLSDDIARSLSAVSVRVSVVKGKNTIGIELPNQKREIVYLRGLLESKAYEEKFKLPLILGKDIGGEAQIADLAKMPHLLVAGTTGSGKSVAINTMILSLLYKMTPEECKFIMVDPKMLELSIYDGIPHLLTPVVTEPKKAVIALKWAVKEMENRYRAMSKLGVRNIEGYNQRMKQALAKDEVISQRIQTGFGEDGAPIFEEQPLDLKTFPYIVVIVDEMADLMLVAGKEIESTIQRLAQMARAAGIHLIMATQRPSVDVITGTIKANFPTRISFQVTSKIDSRTILGEQGAEQLLGQGDMLYMPGGSKILRVHGPFVSDDEVASVVKHLKQQAVPSYMEEVTRDEEEEGLSAQASFGSMGFNATKASKEDQLYDQAVALIASERKASTSFVQRHLRIGYNNAARLIERMEKEGVVSQPNHSGRREVLLPEANEDGF